MVQDTIKKALIEIAYKTDDLKQQSAALNGLLDETKARMKEVEKESGKNSVAYVELAGKLRETQKAIRDTNREYDNTTLALKAQSNSIEQNRALLASLTAAHIKVSQAEGAASKAAQAAAAQMKAVHDVLVIQEKAYGDSHRVIGEYERATAGLSETLKDHLTANSSVGVIYNQVANAAGGVGTAVSNLKNVVTQFNTVVSNHNKLQSELKAAQAASTAAAEAAAIAQKQLAAGEISATEAQEAQTLATKAQTVAQDLETAATTRAETSLKLLKIALASTGIGLLIIALGTLVAYFEETNEGSKKLQVIMAQLNAIFQEAMKLIAPIGKAISDTFTQSQGPILLLTGMLRNLLLPISTIVKIFNDLKNGNFKQAFVDIKDGAVDFAKNSWDILKGTGETVVDLTKNLGKAGETMNKQGINFKSAAAAAAAVTVERQKLNKAEREWSEQRLKEQGEFDLYIKKFRDMNLSEQERLANGEKAKKLRKEMFDTDLKYANLSENLTEREQALQSKKDYQAITDAKNHVQELKNQYDMDVQNVENRQSRLDKAGETRAQKEAKGLTDAESIRKQSLTRQLQDIYDAYGDELLAQDQHFNDEHAKLRKIYAEKLITEQEYHRVSAQLEAEHHANIQQVIEKFTLQDAQKAQQASNELLAIEIEGMQDGLEKTIAQMKQQTSVKAQLIDAEADALYKQYQQQQKQIADLKSKGNLDDARAIEASEKITLELLKKNGEKRAQVIANSIKEENKKRHDAANADKLSKDEADVIDAKLSHNAEKEHDALLKQLEDKHTIELEKSGLTNDAKLLLDKQYEEAKAQIEQQYREKRIDKALKYEGVIQQAAFSILSNAIQHQGQAKEQQLQKDKARELSNTNLTSGQKAAIEEKYRKLEAQQKVKEFKANQKLSIAQALINGAQAITKAYAELGPLGFATLAPIIATTAIEVGTIAAQKPPAYARGGLHYSSDGRGGVLPGYSKTDNTNAFLRSGEAVVVSEAMQNPWARSIVSAINQAHGGRSFDGAAPYNGWLYPGFASGGIYSGSTYLPTYNNATKAAPGLPVDELAGKIGQQLANIRFPDVFVDVKDINHQQGIFAQTTNRVDL